MDVIAGPCTIDTPSNLALIGSAVKDAGATVLKGGAFKPLTWPKGMRQAHQQELGAPGIDMLRKTAGSLGLPCMAELTSEAHITSDWLFASLDRIQVGARNQQNFQLLELVAATQKPVMLKRHFGCSLDELYASVCYVTEGGCQDVWVCERGVVAPHQHGYRFLLDLQGVKEWTRRYPDIPIIVDCSHWQGSVMARERGHVFENTLWAAQAARMSGVAGIYVDVHPNPPDALVDPYQALTLDQFAQLMKEMQ